MEGVPPSFPQEGRTHSYPKSIIISRWTAAVDLRSRVFVFFPQCCFLSYLTTPWCPFLLIARISIDSYSNLGGSDLFPFSKSECTIMRLRYTLFPLSYFSESRECGIPR